MTATELAFEKIVSHPQCQARVGRLNEDHVKDLMFALTSGTRKPEEPRVFEVDGKYLLTDGHHTLKAYERLGVKTVPVMLKAGAKLADAIKDAAKANRTHGLKRDVPTKERAVLLYHDADPEASGRQIADEVGVSHDFAEKVLKRHGKKKLAGVKVKGRDGKAYPAKPTTPAAGAPAKKTEAEKKAEATAKKETTKEAGAKKDAEAKKADPEKAAEGKAAAAAATPAEPPAPPVVRDVFGLAVPDGLREAFERRDELLEVAALLSQASKLFNAASDGGKENNVARTHPCCAALEAGSVRSNIQAAAGALRQGMPHCVCPKCQGRGVTCNVCGSIGFQNAVGFKHLPDELKKKAEEAGAKSLEAKK